ncbi:MAG: transcription elongation factor GreA [Candidatus Kerfeldbacteria bacterium]|nr:transcription elongation factor GreA [Candidatus Kerfeldbacteria bacterium]
MMTDRISYLTKEGRDKLQAEYETLIHTRRKEIASRIQEAKELGDLSENAEYQEAKNEQAFNEGRIEELETILKHMVIIDDGRRSNADVIEVGSFLTAKRDGQKLELHIVGSNEADPLRGKISNESPLGRSLLGRKIGETVVVTTPKGEVSYEVLTLR